VENVNEARWRAVEARDERMDGVIVYAVKTTGIYCRPGCRSRRPLRRNVEFYATPGEATAAGYRACLRCRPDQVQPSDPLVAAVISVCRRLEQPGSGATVAEMAADLGYSERHLRRRFVEIVGVSMGSYQRAQKASRIRTALREGMAVTNAVFEAGYGSSRSFYEHGATQLGMYPGRYRRGGQDERIRYTSVATPLGIVVVACTPRGVCFVQLGPDEAALTAALVTEFPSAHVERDDDGLVEVALVLVGAVRGDADAAALPVDLAGTAFQIRVWEALRAIPAGQTRTYSEVAAQIGAPAAVRAVASACAANTVAIAVPCHRVVRRDGSLGGYRWGIAAKEALLAVEEAGGSSR
jgi:AraC family transcriptional regulator of adaptative response/methylated-DNA-[protein]-cysteine methyltransferase